MNEAFEGTLITDSDIHKELTQRKKKVVFETVRINKRTTVQAVIEEKSEEGWKPTKRKSKKSVRFEKSKEAAVQLEDDIWSMLAQMGFNYMNKGHHFKVLTLKHDYRQIDVLAVDNESAVFIGCNTKK